MKSERVSHAGVDCRHPEHCDVELEPYSVGDAHGVAIPRPDDMLQLRGKSVARREAEVAVRFASAHSVPVGLPLLRASILSAANARASARVHRYYLTDPSACR